MNDKLTCFKLNWYDGGLCCTEYTAQEEITIYRKDNRLVFKELNGYGVICSCEIVPIESNQVSTFFEFLENTYDAWGNDHTAAVGDGGKWKVRMWHSSHKVKTVCGTGKYPPNGKKMEQHLRTMIEDCKRSIEPKLFGCG